MEAISVLIVGLGVMVAIGWFVQSIALIEVRPNSVPMAFNTAVLFVFSGIALQLSSFGRFRATQLMGLLIGAFGLIAAIQDLAILDFGIDQILFRPGLIVASSGLPKRMSAVTASCFALAGLAFCLMGRQRVWGGRPFVLACLGMAVGVGGVVSLLGYITGLTAMYSWGRLTDVAANTAFGLALLGAGIFLQGWKEARLTGGSSLSWLPIPVGIALAVFSAILCRAVRLEGIGTQATLAYIILAFGLTASVLVAGTIHLALRARQACVRAEREIEERRQSEARLRQSEERFRGLFESMDEGFATCEMIWDGEGKPLDFRWLNVNGAFGRLTGLAVEQVVGRRAKEMIPGLESFWVEAFGRVEQSGQSERFTHRVATLGREYEAYAWRTCVGQFAVVFTDVTVRRQAEALLRLQGEALCSTANAIAIAGPDGIIQWVNPAFELLTGYSAEEATGQNPRMLKSDQHEAGFYQKMWKTISAGGVWHGELVNRRKNGSLYTEEMTITPVTDAAGAITHFIAIKQDISERKRTEEALRLAHEQIKEHAEKLEQTVVERTARMQESVNELEGFSYSITHDLRAPLRAMQSFAMLLQEECAGCARPQSMEYFCRMKNAASRMDKLIQDSLDYAKVAREQLPLSPVDLTPLLGSMIDSYPNLQPLSREIKVELKGLVVMGNEAGLTQCFSNLLDNALKFVAPGVQPRIRVWGERRENKVRIWVEDNGIGIPQDACGKLFGMFQRLHSENAYPGTGIGLSIVRKAVQRMRGEVGFESEVGKGSRFWIELPQAE